MQLPTTIKECHELLEEQQKVITELKAMMVSMSLRIKNLENQLSQNSRNSHRPSSSDGYRKKPALGGNPKGPRGGKPGHGGNTLKMVDTVDHRQPIYPEQCSCGASLKGEDMVLHTRRQVFDLPQPRIEVNEYQSFSCRGPRCDAQVIGRFPEGINAPTQYGSRVRALTNLLYAGHHPSHQSIRELFHNLYGHELNEATIQAATQDLHVKLQTSELHLIQLVAQRLVVHFDETGQRVAGKLNWLHVASTENLTYLFAHPYRGSKAQESSESVLSSYMGTAVHDCLPVYLTNMISFHSICGAHLLRELTALKEPGSHWAELMHQVLMQLYEASDKGQGKVKNIKTWLSIYNQICKIADKEEPPHQQGPRGRVKQTKGRNLLGRLTKYRRYVLAFAEYDDIPFTNNLAERDLRPAKIKQKVSGCFRTRAGAQRFARIRSFTSTARKQSRYIFNELVNAINGQSFVLQLAVGGI